MSRQRATFSLEEALRLAELPGEREGRIYYFRRVALAPIRQGFDRREWLARVQETLQSEAATAVPGGHPHARAANAVYFDNPGQVLEILLRESLGPVYEVPWFAFSGLDVPPQTGATEITRAVVERLCQPGMPLPIAASIILSAVRSAGPERLLTALQVERVQSWLRVWDPHDIAAGEPLSMPLPPHLRQHLSHAVRGFGVQEPRTVWLATLVAAFLLPSAAPATAAPVSLGRSMLKSLEDGETPQLAIKNASVRESPVTAAPATAHVDSEDLDPTPGIRTDKQSVVTDRSDSVTAPDNELEPLDTEAPTDPAHTHLLGEPTAAAGLYFLLNALRYLGIDAAPREVHLIDHVLRRLAIHAKVDPTDPILLALSPASSLPASPQVRTWAVAVRRWCWRHARITTREIIKRPGHVWLTRMDLDVTLGFPAVDVRIRKVGLDLDPGPVSALGDLGRTVRFHYREQDRP